MEREGFRLQMASNDPIRFPRYPLRLNASVAGRHDGDRIRVSQDWLRDPIVAAHEEIHDRVFQMTLDGALHQVMNGIGTSIRDTDDQVKVAAGLVDRRMYKTSVVAQEIAATYLGIHTATFDDVNCFSRLPGRYQVFYRAFEPSLGRIESLVLRYIVGWSAVRLVFSSGYVLRLLPGFPQELPIQTTEESPSRRIRAVIEVLEHLELEELVGFCAEAAGNPFDLTSDKAWFEHLDTELMIRDKIGTALSPWLGKKSRLQFLLDKGAREAFDLIRGLSESHGPFTWNPQAQPDGVVNTLDGLVRNQARRLGRARIVSNCAPEKPGALSVHIVQELFHSPRMRLVAFSAPNGPAVREFDLIAFVDPLDGGTVLHGTISSSQLLMEAQDRVQRSVRGSKFAASSLVVVAALSSPQDFTWAFEELYPRTVIGAESGRVQSIPKDEMVYYMYDDVLSWLDLMAGLAPMEFLHIQEGREKGPEGWVGDGGVHAFAASVKGVPGLFLKVLTSAAGIHLSSSFRNQYRGCVPLGEMGEEKKARARETIKVVGTLLPHVWKEF